MRGELERPRGHRPDRLHGPQAAHSPSPRPLTPAQATRIQPVGLPDTVAFISVNDLGRRYLRHDVYIGDAQLRDQIRLRATHLGWSDNGRIEVVRPITQRWRIGSAAASSASRAVLSASAPAVMANQPSPCSAARAGGASDIPPTRMGGTAAGGAS